MVRQPVAAASVVGDVAEQPGSGGPTEHHVEPVDDKELAILDALSTGPYRLRSVSGVAADTGFDYGTTLSLLESLEGRGYVARNRNEK
jgi:DNA-binding MarR family transcriptional regulator